MIGVSHRVLWGRDSAMKRIRCIIAVSVFLLVLIQGGHPVLSSGREVPRDIRNAGSGVAGACASAHSRGTGYEETVILRLPGDSRIHVERFDGSAEAPSITLAEWRQLVFEMSNAAAGRDSWPNIREIERRAGMTRAKGAIPLTIAHFGYETIRAGVLEAGDVSLRDGRPVPTVDNATIGSTAFACAPMKEYTHRGNSVRFVFSERFYITNDRRRPARLAADFGDGTGFRMIRFGQEQEVHYGETGRKIISVRVTLEDGTILDARSYFTVEHLQTPAPGDTIAVTASIPYLNEYGTGEAYVYLSPLHVSIVNPVVVVEGFDIDNSMYWDELYYLLNQEDLIESLRNDGYDAVVLNFTDATDYMQKNAFVLVELLQQLLSLISSRDDMAVVGASMGGLIARYALAYMEQEGIEHGTRLYMSFDSPHRGANIPLGIQYWMEFFSEDSADAAFLRDRLNSPAARQLLVYHFTDPPGQAGENDPLMDSFNADLAAVGDYPAIPRKVAVANGSGYGMGQGFAAGDQLILYEYSSLLVDIVGNVWAVPDESPGMIFDGLMDLIWPLPDRDMQVTVSGTQPYDNAPGGTRASMVQMDTTEAPYGDIVALHDDHCFIPTVSALDLETADLFHDIAGDPSIMDLTPFDAIFYAATNEEHVTITPENAVWIIYELELGVTGIEEGETPSAPALHQNYPNPFNPSTRIDLIMPRAGWARLTVFDVTGGRVAIIFDGALDRGPHSVSWNGRDTGGRSAATGVYFYRLEACGTVMTRKMVLLR
jgi:hypothetical protein